MKHLKTFESYLVEKAEEKYIAHVDDSRKPGGSDRQIKKDYGLEVKNRDSSGFDIIGAKEDVEMFINDYALMFTDIELYESDVKESNLNEKIEYVSDDRFKDEASLKADILEKAGPALATFLKDKGIDWPTDFEISVQANRIKLVSKPVTGADLGIMQYGFKEVYITFFNGGYIEFRAATAKDGFEFGPYIWTNLNYSYQHGSADTSSQGSNGCTMFVPGAQTGNIWYDVVNGVWLDQDEAQKVGA